MPNQLPSGLLRAVPDRQQSGPLARQRLAQPALVGGSAAYASWTRPCVAISAVLQPLRHRLSLVLQLRKHVRAFRDHYDSRAVLQPPREAVHCRLRIRVAGTPQFGPVRL